MTLEGIQAALKQRFPMLMVDSVISLEPGKSIRTIKNVISDEVPGCETLPEPFILESIGQSASLLFVESTGTATGLEEFLLLASIVELSFLKPVIPGDRMCIRVEVAKFTVDFAVVDAVVTVDSSEVAKGRLGFARRSL